MSPLSRSSQYSDVKQLNIPLVVKVDQNAFGLLSGRPHEIVSLHSWAPNLLSSCRNFGLWLPELCSKVLNPETVSATDLS